MGRWFQRNADASPQKAASCTVTPAPLATLWLTLDQTGALTDVSEVLQRDVPSAQVGTHIQRCLASRTQLLSADVSHWRTGVVDIDFIGGSGRAVHTRGWLASTEGGWQLQLLPIDDLLGQLQAQERRRYYLSQASIWAERLRSTTDEHLPEHCQALLGELAGLLGISQAALVLRCGAQNWQLFAQYSQYTYEALAFHQGALAQELDSRDSRGCVQLLAGNRLGPWPTWLVPHQQEQGQAWLVLIDYIADERSNGLREADWLQLSATFSSALLARLSQQHSQTEQIRQQAVHELLGAGWWEYHCAKEEIEFAPSLAHSLQLPALRLALAQWLEQVHPAERDEVRVRLVRLASAGEPFSVSARIADAKQFNWYQLQGRVVGQGSAKRLCGLMVDIGEMKSQQASASVADARLRSLLGNAPAVVYVQRYAEGAWPLEYCSESLHALLGWQFADLAEGQLVDYVCADDLDIFFGRARELLATGAVSCRYRLRDQAGNWHWILDEAKLLRDAEGVPHETVGVWLDVTEATLAAERIRESEERYRVLVEDSPAMICRYSPDLTLSFANKPLADYLVTTAPLLVGENLRQWLSDEQLQVFEQRLAQLSSEQPLSTDEVCMHLPGRDYAWWIWSQRGLFDEHGVLQEVQAVARDNTAVRRAQQQLMQGAKMATLGEMATGMAHEMNQPLNVMRMAVGNVLRKADQGELALDYLREKLLRIEAQVERAAKIVDHMRVFGRRSEVEQQLFNPFDAVDGALSLLEENLRNKGVQVVLKEWRGAALQVRGFSDQMEQVLINLMVNAGDAMLNRQKDGSCAHPCIEISGEQQGERLLIYVQDNGGGIDPLLMERIFEPFFTTKEIGKGTGLGLSVSFGIVENMGGELSVSNVADGARFCINLPLSESS